ncbi:MAG: chorismate synthase [Thermovirgaceae bacterium]
MALRFLTSGESHGRGLLVVVEGLPAGLEVFPEDLEKGLARRRRGYGRGARMRLEKDRLTIWSGIRNGKTTGAPCGISIENEEWEKWRPVLDPARHDAAGATAGNVSCPRPGHADLAGAVKYGHRDMRNVLERASARSTAAWTAAGLLAGLLLADIGVRVRGAVLSIGGTEAAPPDSEAEWETAMSSDLGCPEKSAEAAFTERIKEADEKKDTLGGAFLVSVTGLPPGVGSYAEWDRRLDGRLAAAVMAIPGIKGVEIGDGFRLAGLPGSLAHDAIFPDGRGGLERRSNHAGGLEGGMANGEEVLLKAVMKPIPTLRKPLPSVDVTTGETVSAHRERGDVCAVPAACVVAEAMVAWIIAAAVTEQFGGDRMEDLRRRFNDYVSEAGRFPHGRD